jgi:hypothetical protein
MPSNEFEERLIKIVRSSPALMEMLAAARSLNLESWCIGAGVVRSLVWDHLHGFREQSHVEDVDVVYYDDSIDGPQDTVLAAQLTESLPSVRWEVTNQAWIHEWFLEAHAQVVPPLRSLADGIATWPEYATCVGVSLRADDAIEVIAPHGLEDLFGLKIRHNPSRASAAVFTERVATKRFTERWPMVSLDLNV